jgi:hypothetical protein
MIMTKTRRIFSMRRGHSYWLDYKITEADWNAIACISNYCEKKGVETSFISRLDCDTGGLELTFTTSGKKPVVLRLATNGNANISFYKNWDAPIPQQVKQCGDIKQSWESTGRAICSFR